VRIKSKANNNLLPTCIEGIYFSRANKSVGDCGNREKEAGENLLHQDSRPQHGKTMTKENGMRNWLYQIQEVNFTRGEIPKEIPGTLGKGLAVAHFRGKYQT
jgi:hypothetical protein